MEQPECIKQGHIDTVAIVQVRISIDITTGLRAVAKQLMVERIMLLKSRLSKVFEGIVINLLASLAGAEELEVGTG